MLRDALCTAIKFYRFERHHSSDLFHALRRALGRANLYIRQYEREDRSAGRPTTGYGMYDLPLLVSYSRSGTNWIRYVIETISGLPTPGQTRVHEGTDYIIDRAHCGFPGMDFHPKVILLLRDYRECLVRHHQKQWEAEKDVVSFLEKKSIDQPPSWYIHNIEAFDKYRGEKEVIYYEEEILMNPKKSVNKVGEIINFDGQKKERFLEEIDKHVRRSVELYKGGGHSTSTPKKKDSMYHAKRNLTENQINKFDDFFSKKFPRLYKDYLSKYDTRGENI